MPIKNHVRDVLKVEGRDGVDLLNRLSTQDLRLSKEEPGFWDTLFCDEKGKLVDWTSLWRTKDGLFLLTSKGRGSTVVDWVERFTIMEDCRLEPLPEFEVCEYFGGSAPQGHEGFLKIEQGELCRYLKIVKRGCIDEDGVDDAYQRWRIESGIPSPDFEFAERRNPLELRLEPVAIGWNKGCYIGQEVISRLDSYDKVQRYLMGVESDTKMLRGKKILVDKKIVGTLSSVVDSPGLCLGLAVVKREYCEDGLSVELQSGGGATLKVRPFGA